MLRVERTFDLATKAAHELADSLRTITKNKPVVFGVCGGRSVARVFAALREEIVPWERVHVFLVDERLVPLSDPQSNFWLVREHLTGPLIDAGLLPRDNVHPFVVDRTRLDYGLDEYVRELARLGTFDVVLLSAGEDGHIAGLFPHHAALNANDPFVLLHDSPKPPKDRMTASPGTISSAKVAIVLFEGMHKRGALALFLETDDVRVCPAVLVKQVPDAVVVTDQDE